MSFLIVQPIGHSPRERTTNGLRAYVSWDASVTLDPHQRELVLKSVERVQNVAACSWHHDRSTDEYRLLLERCNDLKWAGESGVAQEVCAAIALACGREFVLRVGPERVD